MKTIYDMTISELEKKMMWHLRQVREIKRLTKRRRAGFVGTEKHITWKGSQI